MNIRKKKTQVLAAAKAGISERSARRIDGASTLPSQTPRRYWRSRVDPFLQVWDSEVLPLLKSAPYHEVAPHLVLMAFLHRVVNGGGTLEREYAIGAGRMDLCLRFGAVTLAMELKVWRDGAPDPLAEGLSQLDGYLAGLGLDAGWPIVFDRRANQPPIAERTASADQRSPSGRCITLVRA